mgnify:CR=1 FL=1
MNSIPLEVCEKEENYLSQDIINTIFSFLIDTKDTKDIKSKESLIENLKLVNYEMYDTTETFLNNNLEYKYRNEVQEILDYEYDSNDELEYSEDYEEDEDNREEEMGYIYVNDEDNRYDY